MKSWLKKIALALTAAAGVAGVAVGQEPANADVVNVLNELRREMAEMKAKNAALEAQLAGMKMNGGLVQVVYDKDGKPVATQPIQGQPTCGPNWCPQPSCCKGAGIYAFGEWLRWRAREHTTGYSGLITDDSFGDGYSVDAASTEFRWDNGFRFGVGYRTEHCWDVNFVFTWYETDGRHRLGFDDAGDPLGDNDDVYAALMDRDLAFQVIGFADDIINGRVDLAAQQKTLRYRTYDLNFGKACEPCCGLTILPTIGFRYADLRNNEETFYADPSSDFLYFMERQVRMKGYGLRAGLSTQYAICKCLTLHADSAVSLLFADFDTDRIDIAINTGDEESKAREYAATIKTVVPVLELRVGLSYNWKCLSLAAGWEFQHWFNMRQHVDVFNPLLGIEGLEDVVQYRVETTDLSFYGWFLRAGIVY